MREIQDVDIEGPVIKDRSWVVDGLYHIPFEELKLLVESLVGKQLGGQPTHKELVETAMVFYDGSNETVRNNFMALVVRYQHRKELFWSRGFIGQFVDFCKFLQEGDFGKSGQYRFTGVNPYTISQALNSIMTRPVFNKIPIKAKDGVVPEVRLTTIEPITSEGKQQYDSKGRQLTRLVFDWNAIFSETRSIFCKDTYEWNMYPFAFRKFWFGDIEEGQEKEYSRIFGKFVTPAEGAAAANTALAASGHTLGRGLIELFRSPLAKGRSGKGIILDTENKAKCPKCGSPLKFGEQPLMAPTTKGNPVQIGIQLVTKCTKCDYEVSEKQMWHETIEQDALDVAVSSIFLRDCLAYKLGRFMGFTTPQIKKKLSEVYLTEGDLEPWVLGNAGPSTIQGYKWTLRINREYLDTMRSEYNAPVKSQKYWRGIYTLQHELIHIFTDIQVSEKSFIYEEAKTPLLQYLFALKNFENVATVVAAEEDLSRMARNQRLKYTAYAGRGYLPKTFFYFDGLLEIGTVLGYDVLYKMLRGIIQNKMTGDRVDEELERTYKYFFKDGEGNPRYSSPISKTTEKAFGFIRDMRRLYEVN